MKRIYLDHAATTPMFDQVSEAMLPYLHSSFGNPSSIHLEGRQAKQALDDARESFASALGCEFAEVTFCSSATEAANLGLIGTCLGYSGPRRTVLISGADHHCLLNSSKILARLGFTTSIVPVLSDSTIDLDAFEQMLSDDVLIAAVMHTNNETGAVNPTDEVSTLTGAKGAYFLCDLVQAPLSKWALGADLKFIASHKIGGPKGCGVLASRFPATPASLAVGGGQERELRAGTENVAAIVGAATALEIARANESAMIAAKRVAKNAFTTALHSAASPTIPSLDHDSIANIRFPGADAESMLIRLDRAGLSASTGSACSSGSIEPSHVLLASGISEKDARECLRFSFGWNSDPLDSRRAADIVNTEYSAVVTGRAAK